MELWLREKGFDNIQILQQDNLEERFLEKRTLPDNIWYLITVKAYSNPKFFVINQNTDKKSETLLPNGAVSFL
ncbi:MAG: hypothetical protein WBA93_25305 [Microcoleaceae cyanobacterium]